MKHFGKLSAVLAAGSIATAGLALGAGSANAATPVNYVCQFSDGLGGTVPVTVPLTATFPTTPLQAGTPVPAGLVPVSALLDLSGLQSAPAVTTLLAQTLGLDGTLGGSVLLDPAHPIMLGSVPVTTTLTAAPTQLLNLLSTLSMTGSGTLGAFTPTGSGAENVTLPSTFNLVPSGVSGSSLGTPAPVTFPAVPCTSSTGASVVVGQVQVAPAASTQVGKLVVKGPKKAKFGKAVVFKVSQTNGTGTVLAKVGKKVVGRGTLTNGAASVKVKHLKKGKDKIVFSVGTAKVTVKITVR